MKKLALLAALTALVSFALPAAATPGAAAASKVLSRIEARDCAGAAILLREGLAQDYPKVDLLAGSMFEDGVCVKADWDRAVRFYSKAFAGGEKEAMYRLIAGFAAPEHGPDMAAALWWANRPKDEFSFKVCKVSELNRNDPDRFVEEVRAFPPARLATCNYLIGVLAAMSGEIRRPDIARMFSISGYVSVRFEPAVPRIATQEYGMTVWGDNHLQAERKAVLEAAMRQAGERVLKRYPQPAAMVPDSVADMKFVFLYE